MSMKTFTAGERLFAADLNDNFDETKKAGNITSGTIDAARLPAPPAPPAGIGSNVVQTALLAATFTTTSTTFTNLTGLTATITPTSATSKVLVIVQVGLSVSPYDSGNRGVFLRVAGGNAGNYIGDASGSLVRSAAFLHLSGDFNRYGSDRDQQQRVVVYLDSPATTSATTYSAQVRVTSGAAVFVNRSAGAEAARTASSITLIEVAA